MTRVYGLISAAARLIAAGALAYGAIKAVERGGVFFYGVAIVLALLALASLSFAGLLVYAVCRDPEFRVDT
jgi:uncharacterized membrane protein (DUF2068 family)